MLFWPHIRQAHYWHAALLLGTTSLTYCARTVERPLTPQQVRIPTASPSAAPPSAAPSSQGPSSLRFNKDGFAATVFADVDEDSLEVKGTQQGEKVVVRLRKGGRTVALPACDGTGKCPTQFAVESMDLPGTGWAKGMTLAFLTLFTRPTRCSSEQNGAIALFSADGTLLASAPWTSSSCGSTGGTLFVRAGASPVILVGEDGGSEALDVQGYVPWVLRESDGALVEGPRIPLREVAYDGSADPPSGGCNLTGVIEGSELGLKVTATLTPRWTKPATSETLTTYWKVNGAEIEAPRNQTGAGCSYPQ